MMAEGARRQGCLLGGTGSASRPRRSDADCRRAATAGAAAASGLARCCQPARRPAPPRAHDRSVRPCRCSPPHLSCSRRCRRSSTAGGAGTSSEPKRWWRYGVPRVSADVDVTVALASDDPQRFARDMEAAGFEPAHRRSGVPAANPCPAVRPRRHRHAVGCRAGGVRSRRRVRRTERRSKDIGGARRPLVGAGTSSDRQAVVAYAGRESERRRGRRAASGACTDPASTGIESCGCCDCSRRPSARAICYRASNRLPRSPVTTEKQCRGNDHAAQPAERTSACSSTVRVADSCLSGG